MQWWCHSYSVAVEIRNHDNTYICEAVYCVLGGDNVCRDFLIVKETIKDELTAFPVQLATTWNPLQEEGEREEGGREGKREESIEMNKAQRVYGIIMSSTWSLSIEMLKSESPKYSTEPEKTKNYNQNIFTRNELRECV